MDIFCSIKYNIFQLQHLLVVVPTCLAEANFLLLVSVSVARSFILLCAMPIN